MGFQDAQSQCKEAGGELAMITSQDTHDAIYQITGEFFSLCSIMYFERLQIQMPNSSIQITLASNYIKQSSCLPTCIYIFILCLPACSVTRLGDF